MSSSRQVWLSTQRMEAALQFVACCARYDVTEAVEQATREVRVPPRGRRGLQGRAGGGHVAEGEGEGGAGPALLCCERMEGVGGG